MSDIWTRVDEAIDTDPLQLRDIVTEVLRRAQKAEALLRDLVDSDDCWFDHHGGCQAHGYLELDAGERCPQAEAKELIAALDAD